MNRFSLSFPAMVAAAFLASPSAAAEPEKDPWCRLDDPAWTEAERLRRELGSSDYGMIPCPESADPQALPEELVLPMPCGRRMVFRRVTLPARNLLDHVEVFLGSPPAEGGDATEYARQFTQSGPTESRLAGAFTRPAGNGFERSYYIGKYEVTVPQYRAVVPADGAALKPEDCAAADQAAAEVRRARVLPATEMGWLNAVTFAARYSEWLIAHDQQRIKAGRKPSLPWEDGASGFLRLPTEIEWEYAARGGDATSARQSVPVYAIRAQDGSVTAKPDLDDIAAYRTARQPVVFPDNAPVAYVGQRAPNLLGVYDMVGNADEIVFDLFRPARPDAVGGQAGGFTVRGGNADQSAQYLGVGARREVAFYDFRGPVRPNVTGFRLVISAPVYMNQRSGGFEELSSNPQRLEWFRAALDDIRKSPEGSGRRELQDQLEKLREESVRSGADQKTLLARIADVERALVRSNAELNERNRRIQRQKYTSILMMINAVDNLSRRILVAENEVAKIEKEANERRDPAEKRKILAALEPYAASIKEMKLTNEQNFSYYIESVKDMARSPLDQQVQAESDVVQEFGPRRLAWFDRALPIARDHVSAARDATGALSPNALQKWREDINSRMRQTRR